MQKLRRSLTKIKDYLKIKFKWYEKGDLVCCLWDWEGNSGDMGILLHKTRKICLYINNKPHYDSEEHWSIFNVTQGKYQKWRENGFVHYESV